MSENLNLKTIDTVDPSPFKKLVCTIGELPTSFLESMTYYEMLAWFVNYLQNTIIPTVNNNGEAVTELQELFIELKSYVDNYFDNLDVQEEINNKLDEMAATGELQQIIMEYLSNKIKVIFPLYNKDGTDTLGNCTIVKCYDKSVMIDCFVDDAVTYSGIAEAMYENEIAHLDYFIISHYHNDHYGNYQRLFTSGYLDGCTVILPKDVDNAYISTVATSTAIKSFLEEHNIEWIEADNQSITLNDMTMNIYNGSAEDYAYYDTLGSIAYNNYSLVVEFLYNNRKILIPGDCEYYGCEYIASRYLHSNYDVLQDNHHSLSGCSSTYANMVAPKYVACPTSVGMINHNTGRRGALILNWDIYTPNIYVVGVQPETLVFNVGNDNVVTNKEAIATPDFGTLDTINYYLDSTTNSERRDGSENFPFKSLEEAAALMPKSSLANIRLNVINLQQADDQIIRFNGFKRLTINFNDKEISNEILFSNIPFITLNDVNMTDKFIQLENCNGTINNFTSTSSVATQLVLGHSQVELRGVFSSTNQTAETIFAQRCSLYLVFTSFTFNQTDSSTRIFRLYECTVELSGNTEDVLAAYKPISELTSAQYLRYFSKYEKILTIFTHTTEAASDTINLNEVTTNLNGIKVVCKTSDDYYISTTMPKNCLHYLLSFPLPSGDKATIYWNTGILNLINSNSMSITRSGQLNVGTGGITQAGSDKITIMKVIAIPA